MAFDLATHVVALLRGQDTADTVPSSRDERRIAAAIHRIEREFHVPLSLTTSPATWRAGSTSCGPSVA
ncbi:MAG: hypothetical protein U1E70_13110 [Acetobacteraceae bacterium]